MQFAFERDAAMGDPIPDGLNLTDIGAYVVLRSIYRDHKSGELSLSEAKEEKRKLVAAYEEKVKEDAFYDYLASSFLDARQSVHEYVDAYKEKRTLEIADNIIKALYDIKYIERM